MKFTDILTSDLLVRRARHTRGVGLKKIFLSKFAVLLLVNVMMILLAGLPALHTTQAGNRTASTMNSELTNKRELAGLLNADGTINLEAGLTGSFDVSGYRMELAANQQPRFVPKAIQAGCTDNWDDRFASPGTDNTVWALAVDSNNNVYVGGDFTRIFNVTANRVARWDGNSWSPLGSATQNGVNSSVFALTAIGTDLYVGGNFTTASDSTQLNISTNRIARWSTTSNTWSPLGSPSQNGVNGAVFALMAMGTDLYVGGPFTAASDSTLFNLSTQHIARWNIGSNNWSSLGSATQNGVNGAVWALAVIGTDLYAGGEFNIASDSTQPGISANQIARWSTTSNSWSPLGVGLLNGVSSLVTSLAALGTDLYVGGTFFTATDSTQLNIPVNHLARWSTTSNTWSPLGSPSQNGINLGGQVNALALVGTDLYVGGDFISASSATQLNTSVNRVARWSTTSNSWSPLGSPTQNGVSNRVNALAGVSLDLFVGGEFSTASDGTQVNISVNRITRWSNTSNTWSLQVTPAQNGVAGTSVNALVVIGTDLYVGGAFSFVGNVAAINVARWDGVSWSPLGSPTQNGVTGGQVKAFTVLGTDLFVGGSFTVTSDSIQPSLSVNHIACWSTASNNWSPLGSPSQNGVNNSVFALSMAGTDLYVGGNFTTASDSTQLNISTNRIARWSTTSNTWSPLGSPAQNGMNLGGQVNALALVGTDLYVGGSFPAASDGTQINISVNRIARWSTTSNAWSPLGSGLRNGVNNTVNALAVVGADLYVGGSFITASDSTQLNISVNHIARWSTTSNSWSPLGSPAQNGMNLGGQVNALALVGTDLYVGGDFTTASDSTQANLFVNHIARWSIDFNDWHTLDGGTNSSVYAIASIGNNLYAGGNFGTAGCRVSSLFGRYSILLPEIDVKGNSISIVDGDTTPSPTDFTDFGSASVSGDIITHSFIIENTGPGPLSLASNPPVIISGANAADFTVSAQPAQSIGSGSSTTFTIQFDPSATGLRTATVTIANIDADENPYDFSIQGNGFALSVWTGASTSDWHTAANWSGNTVPVSGADVLLPATGVINEPTISTADVTVGNLTVAANRTLTLANNRPLNLNSGATLTVASGATMVSGSGCTLNCSSGATLVNNGTLTNNQGGTINNGFNALLTNNNTLNNNFGAAINNNFGATLTNASGSTFNNGGTLNNNFGGTLNNFGMLADTGTVSNSGTLALQNGNFTVDSSAFLLIRASGTVTRTTGYVLGKMTRTFATSGSFTFDVGTANGYSPVSVTSTAGTGDLTVGAAQTFHPALSSSSNKVLQRYWSLTATGNLTANLAFNYLQADVLGNESIYRITRIQGNTINAFPNACPSPCVDTTNNTAIINGVSSFSDWTLAEPSAVTAIDLMSFAATGYQDGTYLEWQTGSEVRNLGFNLYRNEGGTRTLMNQHLIAGSALLTGMDTLLKSGQVYAFWDKHVDGKSATEYWLEALDLNGQSSWHGPYFAKFTGSAKPTRSNSPFLGDNPMPTGLTIPLERPAAIQPVKAAQVTLQTALAGQPAIKLSVKHEGWYRVALAELVQAGFDARVSSALLQLYADGQQVPISVITDKNGGLSALEFYGRGIDSPFTDSRVYWLIVGSQAGLRIKQLKGAGFPTTATNFSHTVERKDRTIYFSGLLNGDRENFFGAVIAGQPVEQTLTLTHVDPATTQSATLEIALQGVTSLAHRVTVFLNDNFVTDLQFDGRAAGVAKLAVAPALLKEGDNTLRLVAANGASDISLVDYLRLTYRHTFTADDDALMFTTSGNQLTTVTGFSAANLRVFDVTDPEAPQELMAKVEQRSSGYALTVASPLAGERKLLAIADQQAYQAAGLIANQMSNWRSPANSADLIMLSRREFFSALQPLVALRQSEGLKVALLDVEDVYDEFSFGNKSSQAIKDLFAYARANWKVKPRYVLLAGDASYDAKNYLGAGDADRVPTRLLDTQLMETASDDWLTDFNNDGIGEMAIGRLPVRSAKELEVMVKKLIGYARSEAAQSALLVADQNDGFDFERAVEDLRRLIPSGYRVEQIARGRLDAEAARNQLLDAIARGQKIVNYTGHGSMNMWRENLLTSEDAERLTNGERLPLFVMMSCLNGFFDDPTRDSLSEALMKAEQGGAIAVWASSGMTLPEEQSLMNQQLYRLLFAATSQGVRLGDVLQRAKATTPDPDIRRTWIFLGDPSMKWH
jgi:hypothetical protein